MKVRSLTKRIADRYATWRPKTSSSWERKDLVHPTDVPLLRFCQKEPTGILLLKPTWRTASVRTSFQWGQPWRDPVGIALQKITTFRYKE